MNYKQKIQINKELKSLFHANYPEGTIKCSNESKEHFMVKCQIVYWLKKQGFQIWTEARLKDNSRPDIIAINKHIGYIFEILHSESEAKFSNKLLKDYHQFVVIPIATKNFNYDTFKV